MTKLTKALVDGAHKAYLLEHFPEGSTSLLFPHYAIRFLGSSERVKVASSRIVREDDYCVAVGADGFPLKAE